MIDGIGGGGLIKMFEKDLCIYILEMLGWEYIVLGMVEVLYVLFGLGLCVGMGVG